MIGIVFSYDRALQLDGTLRSFLQHCVDSDEVYLVVICKASSALHRQHYDELGREYAQPGRIHFIVQRDFREDVLRELIQHSNGRPASKSRRLALRLGWRFSFPSDIGLKLNDGRYVLFLVDDNIFVRRFSLREVCAALVASPKAIGFSLRLGLNTTYCYPVNRTQSLPAFTGLMGNVLRFNWTTADGDFGYPLEVSSSIYRLKDLLPVLLRLPFKNPNLLEGQMAGQSYRFRETKPELLCYTQSVTFCNPVNKVQTIAANRSGEQIEYSTEELAQQFELGYRMNLEDYAGFTPTACHQEVELVVEKQRGGA